MGTGRWQVLASEIKASLISGLWTAEVTEAPTGEDRQRRDWEQRADDESNQANATLTRTTDVADDSQPTAAAPRCDDEADGPAPSQAERSSAGGGEVEQRQAEPMQADTDKSQQQARVASPRTVIEEQRGLTHRRPRRV